MKVLHDLVGYEGRKIYQDSDWFSFSLDSILLARFAKVLPRDKQILDIGTGTAPIPLILSLYTKAKITAVEIQPEIASLAAESIAYNKLEDQIIICNQDILQYCARMESDTFDLITCNPPYFEVTEHSYKNKDHHQTLARHEETLSLEEVLKVSKKLLKNGGRLAIVHETRRLLDLLVLFRAYGMEPKRLQLVYSKIGKDSNLCLLEGVKHGKTGMKVLPPLYISTADGSKTTEYLKLLQK